MKKSDKEISQIKYWIELSERVESRVLNAHYFNQGLLYGLLIGLAVNLWVILFYEQIFIKLLYKYQITILVVFTLLGIFSITKLILRGKELSKTLKVLKIAVPKLNKYILQKQGIKLRGIDVTLNNKETEEVRGKIWRILKEIKKKIKSFKTFFKQFLP